MRLAAAKPELKMFQGKINTATSQLIESQNLSPTSETSSSLGASGYGSNSIQRSRVMLLGRVVYMQSIIDNPCSESAFAFS